ncbi:MAG: RNA polymerase sigma factor [Saprospiraceae bacterium]|nr:RNA polymerase sigma factor [Saprospiraceae bacterium]
MAADKGFPRTSENFSDDEGNLSEMGKFSPLKEQIRKVSDQELMSMVQSGDKNKMGDLYERHSRSLFAYFFRLTRDRDRSEDLVQNVFLRMLKYSHNFKGTGQFKFWMYSIARNAWVDEYRKANPLRVADSLEAEADQLIAPGNPVQGYLRKERHQVLHMALDRLVPEQREALVLSRFHDMKYKEIAHLSNCTENTVKSRIHRGLFELKKIVEQLESAGYA